MFLYYWLPNKDICSKQPTANRVKAIKELIEYMKQIRYEQVDLCEAHKIQGEKFEIALDRMEDLANSKNQ
eukprot:Pgem_evm1s4919